MNIHTVEIGRGLTWLAEGFRLFRLNPLIWIVLLLIFLAVNAVLTLVPLLGGIAVTLLQPVLLAGLLAGCDELEHGGELAIEHLFAGFRRNTRPLLLVGALTLAGYAVIGLVSLLAIGSGTVGFGVLRGFNGISPVPDVAMTLGMAIGALLILALTIPIAMAAWFAPALVWFRGLSPIDAMIQSFLGCWRNMLPFLVFGLCALILMVLGSIPLGLGLLVVGPMLIGAIYAGYRDIYPE